jgi:putative tryptophan/tyrosine transport system substrate-binding protein
MLLGGGAAFSWPSAAQTQQPDKLPTIGFLGATSASAWSSWVAAFVQRLNELGWIEGRTVRIEYRWGDGRNERFTKFADELVRLNVDVIVTGGAAIPAAKQAPQSFRSCLPLQAMPSAPAMSRVWRDRVAI